MADIEQRLELTSEQLAEIKNSKKEAELNYYMFLKEMPEEDLGVNEMKYLIYLKEIYKK